MKNVFDFEKTKQNKKKHQKRFWEIAKNYKKRQNKTEKQKNNKQYIPEHPGASVIISLPSIVEHVPASVSHPQLARNVHSLHDVYKEQSTFSPFTFDKKFIKNIHTAIILHKNLNSMIFNLFVCFLRDGTEGSINEPFVNNKM